MIMLVVLSHEHTRTGPTRLHSSVGELCSSCFHGVVAVATSLLVAGCVNHERRGPEDCLARELLRMGKRDQEVRRHVVEHLRKNQTAEIPSELRRQMSRVDKDNLNRLKRIVRQHGWPALTVVGQAAAQAAWLVAQHADSDPEFQARVLELMNPLVVEGEVAATNFALLTDRVLVARGEPQRYGTQYKSVEIDGVVHFGPSTPIVDPNRLEQRRSALKLPSHVEYVRQLREMLGVSKNAPPLPEE